MRDEIRFRQYTVSSKDDKAISRKVSDLRTVTRTDCAFHPTPVTLFDLSDSSHAGNIQNVITADDLFR